MARSINAVPLLLLTIVAGCGPAYPDTVPVSGVVTLDGEAVDGASVMFVPQSGTPARGTTDADGKFTLRTFEEGDGAIPGRHKVTVSKVTMTGGYEADDEGLETGEMTAPPQEIFVVPEVYGSDKTTPIEIEVKPAMEPLPIELSSQ